MLRSAGQVFAYLKVHGVEKTLKHVWHRFSEAWHEWRLGIETSSPVKLSEVGVENPHSVDYGAADYHGLRKAMNSLTIRSGRDVFLDYGSGKGRVLVVAATYPFRKVIGIEVSAQLNRVAKENLRRVRRRLMCKEVELIGADAAQYALPPDVTVLFLFHPFRGETLRRVFANIRKSLAEAPRTLTVVYKNPERFEAELDISDWLAKSREFRCLTGERLAIYRTKS